MNAKAVTLGALMSSDKEIFRYRSGKTIGIGALSTNKVAHIKRDKIFSVIFKMKQAIYH